MTIKTRGELKAENSTDFPNNKKGLISPADLRGQMNDIVDSMFMYEDMGSGGPPVAFLHPDPPSAVARPWVQRGREMCSPFDIITNQDDQDEILSGAGTFDATSQLQEAFLWAKRVEFPGGIQSQPCFLISTTLRLQNDQTLNGNGCRIIITDVGWPLDHTDHAGMFNTKDRSRWRIEGFHFHHPDTVTAMHGSVPFAIYYENGADGWIVNNLFQGTNYETIWGGGDMNDALRYHINHNTFIDCGWGGSDWYALPAIQMNCMDSEAIGNILLRPGMGIGNSGSRNAVVGNVIEDAQSIGIGIGDGYSNEGAIVGNRIRMFSHPTVPRRAFIVDDGATTPATGNLTVFEGNMVHLIGTHGHAVPTGFYVISRLASIGKNIVTGEGTFAALMFPGREEYHSTLDVDGLTIRALTETSFCYGVAATVSGTGVNATLRLRNCTVDGFGGLVHLNYSAGGSFVVGGVLTGGTSGFTGDIVNITIISGTVGTIFLQNTTGTFTPGETITGSTGGSATAAESATSSYAYDVRGVAPAIMNGTMDACWKTGGLLRWGNAGGVQYASNLYNDVAISSNASTAVLPP